MNRIKAIGLSLALLITGGSAFAAPNNGISGSRYVGADFGTATLSSNTTTTEFETSNFRAFLGYQLNRYFAVEGGLSVQPFENTVGEVSEITGMDISVLAALPITSRLSAYARLGYWSWELESPFWDNNTFYQGYTDTDMMYGIGLEYKVSSRFKVRLDAISYEASGDQIEAVSGSLAYSF
jgi:hypothetical protein